jgi:L-asparaginase II
MRLRVEVMVRRGDILESRHQVEFAAVDTAGAPVAVSDQPGLVTTYRSSAKPFQLLPLIERGHAERWGLGAEELAVMTASHTGSPRHLQLVRGILERLELGAEHLACGFHEPMDDESRAHLAVHPDEASALYNNCSGKHAGMLCLAKSEGWPIAGYERAEHPVQQLLGRTVAEIAGMTPEALEIAIDGCNVPVFALPLSAMAKSFARLASARQDSGDAREAALARIREAMIAHPDVVGGAGRFSTALMRATAGKLVAKGGAEGLECTGIPARGVGLAVKVVDGATRAVAPALVAILEHLGFLDDSARRALESEARPTVLNAAGRVVGIIEAMVRVPAHATN